MRHSASLCTLTLASLLALACNDSAVAPPGGLVGEAQLRVTLDRAAPQTAVPLEQIALLLTRGDGETVLDTVLGIPDGADSLELEATVALEDEVEVFELVLALLTPDGAAAFRGADVLELEAGGTAVAAPALSFVWEIIEAGEASTCALGAGGRAFCWGAGASGQLGNGAMDDSPIPVPVSGDLRFVDVGVGGFHACGLTETGAVYCWGEGARGQLGTGSTDGSTVPAPVSGGIAFQSVSVGWGHVCGIGTDGQTYCWGQNNSQQFGMDTGEMCESEQLTTACSTTPVAITTAPAFETVSAGILETCGLTPDGVVHCTNIASQEGGFAPAPNPPGLAFQAVSKGALYQCALGSDARAYCWGVLNTAGQQGSGSAEAAAEPTPIAGDLSLSTVRANPTNSILTHTCGLDGDGNAYCWGWNEAGQLGAETQELCPGEIDFPCSTSPLAVSGGIAFRSITPGLRHTCGVDVNDAAFCWGDNASGQLGTGTTTPSPNSPVRVAAP